MIALRLRKALDELRHFDEYDHLIVNDQLDRAYQVLRAIYLVERARRPAPGGPERPDPELDELRAIVDANNRSRPATHALGLLASEPPS